MFGFESKGRLELLLSNWQRKELILLFPKELKALIDNFYRFELIKTDNKFPNFSNYNSECKQVKSQIKEWTNFYNPMSKIFINKVIQKIWRKVITKYPKNPQIINSKEQFEALLYATYAIFAASFMKRKMKSKEFSAKDVIQQMPKKSQLKLICTDMAHSLNVFLENKNCVTKVEYITNIGLWLKYLDNRVELYYTIYTCHLIIHYWTRKATNHQWNNYFTKIIQNYVTDNILYFVSNG